MNFVRFDWVLGFMDEIIYKRLKIVDEIELEFGVEVDWKL